jgi:hypothetical protein
MMPEGVGQVYDQSPESWGSDGQYLGGDAGGMPPPTGDAMGANEFGVGTDGNIPGGPDGPLGADTAGANFDGAMAAMDGAQAANMAEGMDAANAGAEAAGAEADVPADSPDDAV